MSSNFPSPQKILTTLISKGHHKQENDLTLDWNKTAKPLAYALNQWLEGHHGTSPYMRKVSYKRFLGLIGGTCIVKMKDPDGNDIVDPISGEPRTHFSSHKLCSMFSIKKLEKGQVELLPSVFKKFNMKGLGQEAYKVS
tara:strand:+ start:959 stop:1375 length:417 start_codon:yes stop_codon:yes gene_type:complete